MLIKPNETLFRFHPNGDFHDPVPHYELDPVIRRLDGCLFPEAHRLFDELSIAIYRMAIDINTRLVPRRLSDFDHQVSMADYLSRQKIVIQLPDYRRLSPSTVPFDKWSIHALLKMWGFEPTNIEAMIKKYTSFRGGCYVKITFRGR